MLMRADSFRELDRLTQQFFGGTPGTWSRPATMPVDAYRSDERVIVNVDLPGVAPDSIDLQVERNVLTVRAERRPVNAGEDVQMLLSERQLGVFSRQLFLGDTLDTDHIDASYEAGVLTLTIPISEKSKPRRIQITAPDTGRQEITA
ncbi:MAG TPA: Hsp20/alpha crystallin family protein [Pseudonocardiaceae bacterium]|jgi:HSP20 family protein